MIETELPKSATAILGLIVVFVSLGTAPANAQSAYSRCEDNADWANRIAACQEVIRTGDSPNRLAVAHYYVAANLEVSYEQFQKGDAVSTSVDSQFYVDMVCDPLLIIYAPNNALAQYNCDSFAAGFRQGPPRVGEPTTTDIQRVLDEYSTVLQYDPAHIDARKRRGRVLWLEQRFDEALPDLDIVVRHEPNEGMYRYFRGYAQYASGNYAEAISDIDAALKSDLLSTEQRHSLRGKRAYAFTTTNNFDAAILDYSAVIADESDSWELYLRRGDAYLYAGKPQEAAADFGRALALSPAEESTFLLHQRRGATRMQMGDRVGAIGDFDNALVIRGAAEIYSARGRLQFEVGNYAEARDDLTNALTIGVPDLLARAQAYELRAFASMQLGDEPAAIADFSSVIETHPSPQLYFNRANLYRTIEDLDAALAGYLQVADAEDAPTTMRVRSYLGRAIIFHGRRDVENAMTSYDNFFSQLADADDQTRAFGAQIVQGLVNFGVYSGSAEQYDSELRTALAACIESPQCNP